MGGALGGLPGLYGMPGGGDGNEQYFADIHKIPLSDKSHDINAKADAHAVSGERSEQGTETYIETRGPTGLGAKSKTPYFNVLPKYCKQAEKALERQQIPPDQQKRVRDYFESLQSGK